MKYVLIVVLLATITGCTVDQPPARDASYTAGMCLMLESLIDAAIAPSTSQSHEDAYWAFLDGFAQGSGYNIEQWGIICENATAQHNNQLK